MGIKENRSDCMNTMEQIVMDTRSALMELFDLAGLKQGDLLVVGCSSSEICGGVIGHASSPETGEALAEAILTKSAYVSKAIKRRKESR